MPLSTFKLCLRCNDLRLRWSGTLFFMLTIEDAVSANPSRIGVDRESATPLHSTPSWMLGFVFQDRLANLILFRVLGVHGAVLNTMNTFPVYFPRSDDSVAILASWQLQQLASFNPKISKEE